MKRNTTLWVCIAALVATWLTGCPTDGADAGEGASGSFDALTYNVAGLPQGLSGSDPAANIPQISPLLNAYDVVLAQEDFAYHQELAQQAEHRYQSTTASPQERFYADGLNRFSRLRFERVERVRWVSCFGNATEGSGDCLAEKGFAWAPMELDGDDRAVPIYNLHADAGGGEEDIAAREEGYAQLAAHIEEFVGDGAFIVAGDTNLHGFDEDDEPILSGFLEDTGATDVCRHLSCDDDHIDRFFFRSSDELELTPRDWRVATEFVTAEGEDLSDHPAIATTFEWSWQAP